MTEPLWVQQQLVQRGIADPRVLGAMARVPRELFVPDEDRDRAYADAPIPLPHGQTVSQPYMVALMCEVLALEPGARVLDVGTGSGYAAAVLAELAAEVDTIERIPELVETARTSLALAGYDRVRIHVGDGSRGLPDAAPFDGIAVAAAARDVPPALWEQLRLGGRIAIPLVTGRHRQSLLVLQKTVGGRRTVASVPARFVPLISGP
ncbi:MAG TPA: protein-L-isoaspartate(D-aspartate) O-methyltransferase [Gaiellaceae bacterium]|jgi:protein-L-isoaspartate(D-aspartate) O-methyltransferase